MNYETRVEVERADLTAPPETFDEEAVRVRSKRRRYALIALGIVILLGVAYWMIAGGEGSGTGAPTDDQAPAVSVVAPGRTTIEGVIQATGTLAARREMPVGSVGEGGRVVSVPVEPGQWVRAGQVLAVIDRSVQTPQAEALAAQIEAARADAQLAQANLDRALQLVERGFISKADVDRLTATRDAAVARVKVAEAQLAERRARNAQLNIVAPAAGLLLTRNVEPGQVVGGGSGVLFSIAKGGEMELLAEVGETELAQLSVGSSAEVTPVGADESFTGQIWQVSPVIDEQDRQGIVRIALAYSPDLRPGGFASTTIRSGTVVAPMLPESALQNDGPQAYVYIVGDDNTVVRRNVTTGTITPDGIAVIEGLNGTEQVVLRAGGFLTEGETVRPQPVQAAD